MPPSRMGTGRRPPSWQACVSTEWWRPMVLDGPINGDAFTAYVRHILVPELRRGDVVVMDNLSSHKGKHIR